MYIFNFFLHVEILSSEEILIEKLKKEKEEMQRLRNLNSQSLGKTKAYIAKPINPSPLTMIKPFNLSANNSKMLAKKRVTNSNIDEVNSKIMEQMKKKCEQASDKIKESVFINDTLKLQKTPTNVRYMKKTLGRSVSRSTSKSPLRTKENDDEMQSLSNRIEKYCTISGLNLKEKKNVSKSPLKICYGSKDNEEKMMNFHINNIFNNSESSTSIRKHFGTQNAKIPTEEKIAKDMQTYKFKAKPLNKNIFSNNHNVNYFPQKKQPELETFESVIQKTRMEKQMIDKKEKENKKNQKVTMMKHSKVNRMFSGVNKENCNTMNRQNENSLMLDE